MVDFALHIQSVEFSGQPVSFDDDDGVELKIIHTFRGYSIRKGPQCTPIALGDWIIYEPFFKVVSAKRWHEIEEAQWK